MNISQILTYGSSFVGQTIQEVEDVWANGCALYQISTLQKESFTEEAIRSLHETYGASLFVFREHYFSSRSSSLPQTVQILPLRAQSSSPSSIFLKESLFRVAKAIVVLVCMILTLPVSALALAGAYMCDSKNLCCAIRRGWIRGRESVLRSNHLHNISLPAEPEDSHVTSLDILRIGRALVGYRHVSTEMLAQDNAKNGITAGCALNLSFGSSNEEFAAPFANLDQKILSGENCDQLIQQYEYAITQFIVASIDLDFMTQPRTYGDVFATLQNSRFMILKTPLSYTSDTNQYWGLGRFPKHNVPPNGVILLRRIQKAELGIPEEREKQLIFGYQDGYPVLKYLAAHYRRELLRYIREEFDARTFSYISPDEFLFSA